MPGAGQNFWSRRRAAVRAEAEAEAQAVVARAAAEDEAQRAAEITEKTDAELLADLGLPDPDSLVAGDDFAAFMKKAVPERLRRRALRRLWTSNPVLANLDGLVDDGGDFTDAATVVPDMRTAYQVGKGMLKHVVALAEAAADAAEGQVAGMPEAAAPALAEPADQDIAAAALPQETEAREAAVPQADTLEADPADLAAPGMPPARRHMRFAFAGTGMEG